MKKYNILHIVNIRFFNATAWYAMNLCRVLNAMGHNSKCLVLANTEAHEQAIKMEIPHIAMPFDQKKVTQFPKIYSYIKKVLKEERPDIVNCHRGELYPFFVALKKTFAYKLVRTRGDQRPAKNNFINRFLYSDYTDAIISTNSATTKQLNEELKVPSHKLHTIIGGVNTDFFYPKPQVYQHTREKFGYTKNDYVMGLLGRLDPIKGVEESIKALAKVATKTPKLKLCIIGFDTILTTKEVQSLIEEHSLEDRVQITGKVEEVNNVLNMCDVAILPSVGSETIARAALEFIACDIPLISSQVGVMPDLLEDEARFETANIDSMADFMFKVFLALDDRQSEESKWLQRLRTKQHALIKELTLEAFGEQTLNVYLPLLNK